MIDFGRAKRITIPEGEVDSISINGKTVWGRIAANYVSLGDSIAAGHAINDEWYEGNKEETQYGKNGNASTEVIPGCYTAIIGGNLAERYGAGRVKTVSFARSGDTVADLIAKLDHEAVRKALITADIVTVCIGANDILGPALASIETYISRGNPALIELGAKVDANLAVLADDANPNSYKALFDKMKSINASAKFVFMTIYNPYKYLYLERGTWDRQYSDGFFGPLLDTIPNMDIDIDETVEAMFGIDDLGYFDVLKWEWVSFDWGLDLDNEIRKGLLSTSVVQTMFDRVNVIGDWAEHYIVRLNDILRAKVAAAGSNFALADAKAAFDLVPDRTVPAEKHYNDLVNVEYTRGYDTAAMNWGALWDGSNAAAYWVNLAAGHTSWTNALPSTNPMDYVSFDMDGFAAELVEDVVVKVIIPDIDPHPEAYGHQVLASVFGAAIG